MPHAWIWCLSFSPAIATLDDLFLNWTHGQWGRLSKRNVHLMAKLSLRNSFRLMYTMGLKCPCSLCKRTAPRTISDASVCTTAGLKSGLCNTGSLYSASLRSLKALSDADMRVRLVNSAALDENSGMNLWYQPTKPRKDCTCKIRDTIHNYTFKINTGSVIYHIIKALRFIYNSGSPK